MESRWPNIFIQEGVWSNSVIHRMTYVVLNGAETTIFDFFLLLKGSRTRELGFDQFSVKVYSLYGY